MYQQNLGGCWTDLGGSSGYLCSFMLALLAVHSMQRKGLVPSAAEECETLETLHGAALARACADRGGLS